MHTTGVLTSSAFTFTINGRKKTLEDVFPGFNMYDRIGVIVKDFCGATGASASILAAVTRFYDAYRSKLNSEKCNLRIYPEYFTFHLGKRFGDHQQMDIWPAHREVVVDTNPEKILQAINDRAITRLLIADTYENQSTQFLPETLSSAKERILTTLLYSSTGRVQQPDITIKYPAHVEQYVFNTFDESKDIGILSEDTYNRLQKSRLSLRVNEHIEETYKMISLSEALHMLT